MVTTFADRETHLRQRAARGWIDDEDVTICLREIDRLRALVPWSEDEDGYVQVPLVNRGTLDAAG